ncbi:hypothetical protein XELAEV_18045354mg [Xenopus laevis]|uniref:Uncharacterized protein n=1 Tax=Xenopus laevis TaxID=8355 RepID=A0A974C0G3_XENLA|nr:hypothetical protein XELAEV_18045354mg [Xenopus laevis]
MFLHIRFVKVSTLKEFLGSNTMHFAPTSSNQLSGSLCWLGYLLTTKQTFATCITVVSISIFIHFLCYYWI